MSVLLSLNSIVKRYLKRKRFDGYKVTGTVIRTIKKRDCAPQILCQFYDNGVRRTIIGIADSSEGHNVGDMVGILVDRKTREAHYEKEDGNYIFLCIVIILFALAFIFCMITINIIT